MKNELTARKGGQFVCRFSVENRLLGGCGKTLRGAGFAAVGGVALDHTLLDGLVERGGVLGESLGGILGLAFDDGLAGGVDLAHDSTVLRAALCSRADALFCTLDIRHIG